MQDEAQDHELTEHADKITSLVAKLFKHRGISVKTRKRYQPRLRKKRKKNLLTCLAQKAKRRLLVLNRTPLGKRSYCVLSSNTARGVAANTMLPFLGSATGAEPSSRL